MIEHPDNVRGNLGDLADLTRSIKNKGVLIPALVLPADADGNHALVAGHRRRAAAIAAALETLPVIIRDLTPIEVLDTMLTENDQRADLSVTEQIRAVARYQVLAPDETPTAIGKHRPHRAMGQGPLRCLTTYSTVSVSTCPSPQR